MKKLLMAGVGFASLMASSAMAAEYKVPVRRPVVVAAPVVSWTGFYIGANAGYAWNNLGSVNSYGSPAFQFPGGAGFAPLQAAAIAGVNTNVPIGNSNGFIGGFQIGYNYQFLNWLVAGVEADIQGLTSSSSTGTVTNTQVNTNPAFAGFSTVTTLTATNSIRWLGTARARLGVTATPGLLLYGTAGVAYSDAQSTTGVNQQVLGPAAAAGCGVPNVLCNAYGGSAGITQRWGVAYGGGAEWMFFGNWSAKLEYLHYDLGNGTYSANLANGAVITGAGVTAGSPIYALLQTSSTRFFGDIVRVGINYKFGYEAAPTSRQ